MIQIVYFYAIEMLYDIDFQDVSEVYNQDSDGTFPMMSFGKTLFCGSSIAERESVVARSFPICLLIDGGWFFTPLVFCLLSTTFYYCLKIFTKDVIVKKLWAFVIKWLVAFVCVEVNRTQNTIHMNLHWHSTLYNTAFVIIRKDTEGGKHSLQYWYI